MYRNSSFLRGNVFYLIVLSIMSCCLYHFNVTDPLFEKETIDYERINRARSIRNGETKFI